MKPSRRSCTDCAAWYSSTIAPQRRLPRSGSIGTILSLAALVVVTALATGLTRASAVVVLLGLRGTVVSGRRPRQAAPPPDTVMVSDHNRFATVLPGSRWPEAGLLPSMHSSRRRLPNSGRATDVTAAVTVSPVEWSIRETGAHSGGLGFHDVIDPCGHGSVGISERGAAEEALGLLPLELAAATEWLLRGDRVRSTRRQYAVTKRALDVVVALTVGLVVVVPLLPLIALAIRLDSPGPVFYSQIRVGINGRPFRIYKFRSMCRDAERGGAVWAKVGDPRVTSVGRFMRLTRLDELPQLWNVVRGDMSLVGPRPERPEFTALLEREVPGYAKREVVKPGLTGWAQVCHRYMSTIEDNRTAVEFDLFYVEQASLSLDLKILLRTVPVVVRKQGC